MSRQVPIIGEPFESYVKAQIDNRQKVYGSGFNQSRTPSEITYLNSRTSWLKMASSVEVENTSRVSHLNNLSGIELAKQGVLFNGLSTLDTSENTYNFKSGVTTNSSTINNKAYGFGGTEFGIQPMPGIIDFSIRHENRGSIRTGEIKIKAYNKFQFDLIELLYLRLGFTVMIEWGNSHYLDAEGNTQIFRDSIIDDTNGGWFSFNGKTHLQMLTKVDSFREKYYGNYDAIFGKIVNFNWNFQTDGSYDITVYIASLGDVVESFKVTRLNPITQTTYKATSTEDDKKNINAIHQILKDVTDESEENTDVFNNTSNKEFLYVASAADAERNDSIVDSLNPFYKDANVEKKQYIRFDIFLDLIRNKLIPTIVNNNTCSPLFNLDIETNLRMKAVENLISIDPRVCIIKPQFTEAVRSNQQFQIPENITTVDEYMENFYTGGNFGTGLINNIYLNFDFLRQISSNNTNSKGEMSFFNFFKSVCDGLNRSFGNICDLQVIMYEETNCLSILDANLDVKVDEDGNQLPEDTSNTGIIQIYGYNNNTSNFIKNYSFETQITNELKNMLTIGATANNSVVNEDSTIFSKWNEGLKDRFQQTAINSYPDSCKRHEYRNLKKYTFEELQLTINKITINKLDEDKVEQPSVTPKDALTEFQKLKTTWEYYVLRAFSRNGMSGDYPPAYYEFKHEFIDEGKEIFKNYFISKNKSTYNSTDNPSSNIGFIPIQLSLEIEGMSGMKIYNELRLDTKFLPKNYPDIMEFIVIGVDHALQNSEWTTTLRAISKPKSLVTN